MSADARESMFKNRPLTWLFLIATVCLDVAMLASNDRVSSDASKSLSFLVFNFLVPAQLSVLAIWAALGKRDLLTRAATATILPCALLFFVRLNMSEVLRSAIGAYFSVQVLAVFLWGVLFRRLGIARGLSDADEVTPPMRFSIMELLAWMMLTAIWAFVLKYSALEQLLTDKYAWVWFLTSLTVPAIMIPVFFSPQPAGTRILRVMVLYLLTLLYYGVTRITLGNLGPMPLWSFMQMITQITYIAAWWAVMRMDAVMVERRDVTEHSRETLALFRPDEQEHQEKT